MGYTVHSISDKSRFVSFLETLHSKAIYFEPLHGNNGDRLILMGAKWALRKSRCKLVEKPQLADVILLNGSGGMNDIWHFSLNRLESYRTSYPSLPIIVAPSTYRFKGDQFKRICEINDTPLFFFTRDLISIEIIQNECSASHIDIQPSQDLAFELQDSDFIKNLREGVQEKHVLIVTRGDRESLSKGILTKVKGTWVPTKLRPPLSKARDKLLSLKRWNTYKSLMKDYGIPKNTPLVNQDISCRVTFSEFVATIRDAALIITDRLHVGILGHMLNKETVLFPASYDKTKGVFEMSMSGRNSRTTLIEPKK